MRVEKVSDNKVKITLTLEELEKRDISLAEIEKNASIAKELFIDLIEESNLDEDFALENSQLFIEASSDNSNLFIVTITRIDDIPEFRKYSNSNNKVKNTRKNVHYKVDSNIYWFNNMDCLLDFCNVAKKEDLFFGRNSLYKYNESYFILFNKTTVKNKRFLKTFVFLSEFCESYFATEILNAAVKEKSKLIIKSNAIQKLCKV